MMRVVKEASVLCACLLFAAAISPGHLPNLQDTPQLYSLHYIQAANHKLYYPVDYEGIGPPSILLTVAEYNGIAQAFINMDVTQTWIRDHAVGL